MRQCINYSIVRFRPYRKTDEFVNIGVVSIVPENGEWQYKISELSEDKITRVFPFCNNDVTVNAIRIIDEELGRLSSLSINKMPREVMLAFNNLIKTKEGVVFFSDKKVAIIDCGLSDYTDKLCKEYFEPK